MYLKARITTVLSLTGVLVAGSAAALVNTQVLQNSTTKSSAVVVSLEDEPESVSSVSTAPDVESFPNKLEDVVGVAVTLATTPVVTQQEYAIGESGTVVLDTANSVLTIVAVAPNTGWEVVEQKNTDALSVTITFRSATTLVQFAANALTGVVAWDTQSSLIPQPDNDTTNGGNTTGGKTTVGKSGSEPTESTTGTTQSTTPTTTGTAGTAGKSGTTTTTDDDTTDTTVDDHRGGDGSSHQGGGGDDD